MSEKHPIHYYKDGDILLIAEKTKFLVHKIILSLSSEFFEDLFKLSKPSSNENAKFVKNQPHPTIEINGETSESIDRMLSFIYPNSYTEVTWDNIEDLLRLADKFIISKITKTCEAFLRRYFQDKVCLSFLLAERYSLSTVFKESSKLILDDLAQYHSDSACNDLTEKTRLKLMDAWFNYINSSNKFIEKYKNKIPPYILSLSSLSSVHNKFYIKPSKFMEILCRDLFKKEAIGEAVNIIRNYEPLQYQPDDLKKYYIFIELEN